MRDFTAAIWGTHISPASYPYICQYFGSNVIVVVISHAYWPRHLPPTIVAVILKIIGVRFKMLWKKKNNNYLQEKSRGKSRFNNVLQKLFSAAEKLSEKRMRVALLSFIRNTLYSQFGSTVE